MKILIVGSCGSGKTTLANRLSNYFDIPSFSIDSIVHDDNNNGIKREVDEQIKIINNINKKHKEFIIEGVLREDLDLLLNICDNIIYLDYPKHVTLKRIKRSDSPATVGFAFGKTFSGRTGNEYCAGRYGGGSR